MTFLRIVFLAGLRWEELDYERDLRVVPAERMKNNKEHLVPLIESLNQVLQKLREPNGDQEYAFFSGRSGKYSYINPSFITNHLKNL